jgi:hypothetical protein
MNSLVKGDKISKKFLAFVCANLRPSYNIVRLGANNIILKEKVIFRRM